MRDLMDRFVLLPFTSGCISEYSIPVAIHHNKRTKLHMDSTSTRTREAAKEEGHEHVDDEESLSGESSETDLPRFQKLIKTFSRLFVYKDETETEMGFEIGFPTDVKHVTHIGLDGSVSSIFGQRRWNNLKEPESMNLHSFSSGTA